MRVAEDVVDVCVVHSKGVSSDRVRVENGTRTDCALEGRRRSAREGGGRKCSRVDENDDVSSGRGGTRRWGRSLQLECSRDDDVRASRRGDGVEADTTAMDEDEDDMALEGVEDADEDEDDGIGDE